MKFDSNLDDHQNLKKWRKYNSSGDRKRARFSELSEQEKLWLRDFNLKLIELEKKFHPILLKKERSLQARILTQKDWLCDFNLTSEITFWLREDDPEYEGDDDNILFGFKTTSTVAGAPPDLDNWGFLAAHIDHRDQSFFYSPDHTLEIVCHTLYHLIVNEHFDWRDLLRIGAIYFEISTDEQTGMLNLSPISTR